jgi:hypothetical protein
MAEIRDDSLQEQPGSAVPMFATPEPTREDPQEELEPEPPSLTTTLAARLGLGGRKRDAQDDTLTHTSSRGSRPARIDPEQATIAIAGLIGVLVLGGVWVVQRRTRGEMTLRTPTQEQASDIAAPLARIGCRFLPPGLLAPTLMDALHAATAAGAYATQGPLVIPNRQEEQRDEL